MTRPNSTSREAPEGIPPTRLVVATYGRELKTALFLALSAIPAVTIVATATSTAELVSYCHALRPDVAIVESGLPGGPLGDALTELRASKPGTRILLIGESAEPRGDPELSGVEVFTDLDQLIGTFPEQGVDTP